MVKEEKANGIKKKNYISFLIIKNMQMKNKNNLKQNDNLKLN